MNINARIKNAETNMEAAHETADFVRHGIGHSTALALQWAQLNATLAVAETNLAILDLARRDEVRVEHMLKNTDVNKQTQEIFNRQAHTDKKNKSTLEGKKGKK